MSLPNDESVSLREEASLESPRDRLMLDVVTSYALAIARVGSWLIVCGLVARTFGSTMFALLALIRLTMTPVSYAGLNLGPAVVRCVSSWLRAKDPTVEVVRSEKSQQSNVLEYASRARRVSVTSDWNIATIVVHHLTIVLMLIGIGLAWFFSVVMLKLPTSDSNFNRHDVNWFFGAAMILGIALALRSVTDGLSGLLQIRRRLWVDNSIGIVAECGFVIACFANVGSIWHGSTEVLMQVSINFLISVLLIVLMRTVLTLPKAKLKDLFKTDVALALSLIGTGSALTTAQLADYFYAPFALQLASRKFNAIEIASYSAALMIDAALLLLVAGIATPLLVRVTSAHVHHQLKTIRNLYLSGSLTALALLLMGSLTIWAASDVILKLWLKDVPAGIAAILPLVLIHTTIGGASGVGRSVLIGMGKIRAWTVSSLIGGVSNALLVLLFVLVFDWGLRGIVIATIISVTIRCVIWMPWYILRHTKQISNPSKVGAPMADS